MKTIFFSANLDTIQEWKNRHNEENTVSCYDFRTLKEMLETYELNILIVDYDTVSHELNKLIFADDLPQNVIVLEKVPEIITGKMLISRSIKAYGNARMLSVHYQQMIKTVMDSNIWTYPELTASLIKDTTKDISQDAIELINNRLSLKEIEVIHLVLDGLTNNAIATKLHITTRTVKAHVSAIYNKLHVNDRVSLILLLK